MSFLPKFKFGSSPSKVENVKFYGLNRNENAAEGFFTDTGNMTSRDFPFISSRDGRFLSALPEGFKCLGAGSGKELYFVLNDGVKSYFYYGTEVKGEWDDTDGKEKFFCEVGGAIYIFPDRKLYRMRNDEAIEEYAAAHPKVGEEHTGSIYFSELDGFGVNTNQFKRFGTVTEPFENGDVINIWAFDKASGDKASLFGIDLEEKAALSGENKFKDIYVYGAAFNPSNVYQVSSVNEKYIKIGYRYTYPAEYDEAFFDFSNDVTSRKIYVDSDGYQYLPIHKTDISTSPDYSHLTREFLDYSFTKGMTVYFSHTDSALGDIIPDHAVIEDCGVRAFYTENNHETHAYFKFQPGTFKVEADVESSENGFSYVVLYNENDEKIYITISPKYPSLSGAVCVNNRLWGYKGNVIYASALGKPYILAAYKGLSTDSWTLETGIKRDFTAVCGFGSMPHYFAEDRIIKIYGSAPSSFSTSETMCSGVKEGSSASVIVCGGVLYYLDANGLIEAYTGSYPSVISRNLNEEFTSAMGACDERFLYYILISKSGESKLYTYDILSGIWLCECDKEAFSLLRHKGSIYIFRDGFIECDEDIDTGFEKYAETEFESFLEFPVTDEGLFNMKKLKKVLFKINAEESTSLKVEVRETDSPEYRRIFECVITGGDKVLTIPVDCKRTLGYTVRISARGKWRLEGIMRRVSTGSYKS